MTEWTEHKMGDLISLEYGRGLRDYQNKKAGVPVYGTNGPIGFTDQALSPIPSVIIGRKGAYRGVHYSPVPFFVIDTAFYVKPKTAQIDLLYLYNFLLTQDINAMDSGSAIPSTDRYEVYELELCLPPPPEQRAIASILSILDDKIDLLHRQNKTLEAMAETLFRQWFVEGGSTLCNITELVEFNPRRQLAKGTIAPYLEMAKVSTSVFHPDEWYARVFTSGTKFHNGDALLARITPCLENGKSAYVTFLGEGETGWGSTEFIVLRAKEPIHPLFAYALVRNDDFRSFAEGCLEGSSGRQRVNVDHLMNYEVYRPNEERIDEFNRLAESMLPKMCLNMRQLRCLQMLRDTLLPRLMSGEIHVKMN